MPTRAPALLAALAAVLLGVAACAPFDVAPVIPVLPAERVPAPPPAAVTLIWQPGHYDWDGASYRWVPGQWVPRDGHGPLWSYGSWRRGAAGGWEWVPAHWI